GRLGPFPAVRGFVGDFDAQGDELAAGPEDLVQVLADFSRHDVLPDLAVHASGPQTVHAAGDEDAVAEGQRNERGSLLRLIGVILPGRAVRRGHQTAGGADADVSVVAESELLHHLRPAGPFFDAVFAGIRPVPAV